VIRFKNEMIIGNIDEVLEILQKEIKARSLKKP
jgi:very-short-patch-repair endonuclease